jgi:hypothetical protein
MSKELVNEISTKLAKSYMDKAKTDIESRSKVVSKQLADGEYEKSSNNSTKNIKRAGSWHTAFAKSTTGRAKVKTTEEIENEDKETLVEQSHRIEAVYTDSGKKKKTVMKVQAKSKAQAKNKVGTHLSRSNCDVHSLTHVGMAEEFVIENTEELEEGKTYRNDASFSSKVRNNMKKKKDVADSKRASEKRSVDNE